MLVHTIQRGWSNGGTSIQKTSDVQGTAEINVDATIGATTNSDIEFALDVARVQSFFVVANGAAVLNTNSLGVPANVITLSANTPFLWTVGGGGFTDTTGAEISTDITKLVGVNSGANPVLIQIRALYNSTNP